MVFGSVGFDLGFGENLEMIVKRGWCMGRIILNLVIFVSLKSFEFLRVRFDVGWGVGIVVIIGFFL